MSGKRSAPTSRPWGSVMKTPRITVKWQPYERLRGDLRDAIGDYWPDERRYSDYELLDAVRQMREKLRLLEAEEQRW